MLFSELCKIMVNKATFVGFSGGAIAPIVPWIFPCVTLLLLWGEVKVLGRTTLYVYF